MRNNMRKLLAAILCMAMALLLLPAALAERDGEAADAEGKPFVASAALTEHTDAPKSEETPQMTRGDVFDGDLSLGIKEVSISAGNTVFLKFTAPETGTYHFYSMSEEDTLGYVLNAGKVLIASDDDSGYNRNFAIAVMMNSGDTVYVGTAYYNSSMSGSCTVVAELYDRDDTPLQCGLNAFVLATHGETLYRPFTPSVTGQYTVSSATNADTIGFFALDGKQVRLYDDDGGYWRNFSYTVLLEAGTTYWIAARWFSYDTTGSIPVIIERRTENVGGLKLGLNYVNITTADTTVYSAFRADASGEYRFMGVVPYSEGGLFPTDTFGVVADGGKKIVFYDDDSGFGDAFRIENVPMGTGETFWLGVRYVSSTLSGITTVLLERAVYRYSALAVGSNGFSISTAGTTCYAAFRPTETGRYTFYSTGSSDTFGTLADNNNVVQFYNDDGGEGRNFRFQKDMTAGETYYIGARYIDNSATGTINVVVEKAKTFDGTIEWNSSDVEYKGTTPYVIANGKAQTPRFTVKDKNGSVIGPENYSYEYRENTNAGTGYVIVTFKSMYEGTARGWFKIYLPPSDSIRVENGDGGICISWSAVPNAAGYVIYRRAWSSKTDGWTSFERWDNTTALSYVDGADDHHKVYAGTRYQYGVKAYFAQRVDPVSGALIGGNVGDNYNLGIVSPLKTTVRITTRRLNSLKAGSKQITASWSGSNVFSGYELEYATDALFTKNEKKVQISNPKTYSKTVKSLSNGTEYFFRVRSYHVFEGRTYYGAWSNVLSVKPGSGRTVRNAKSYALLIGECQYNDTASDRNSGTCDVNTMTGILNGVKDDFEVDTRFNLSTDEILRAIENAFIGTTDDSLSVFYYSGHGSADDYGRGGLFACDGKTVSYTQLAAQLNRHVKGRVIVILSCCHSGASINKSLSAKEQDAMLAEAIEAFKGYPLDPDRMTKTGDLANSKFIVIAAAPSDEVSWSHNNVGFDGAGYPQSALTAAIAKGVGCAYPKGVYRGAMPADGNSDGAITLKELYTYAYETVYGWTENLSADGQSGPQHVQYYGPDDAVLFRR